MTARSFTLKDGTVTIRRSDGPLCPAWHCVISRGTSTRAGMAYTARDALRVARGGKAAMTMSIVLPPAAPVEAAQGADTETVPLAAIRARIERAREESMALRHLIGTKDPLAALDVLVDEAIKAQSLGLAEFRAAKAEHATEAAMRGQQRLQAELDALRARLAARSGPEPKPEPAQETTEMSESTLVSGGEVSDPGVPTEASEKADSSTDAPGETSAAPTTIQEAQR